MAKINFDFYDNQDIYNDGDVEAKLLDFYRDKKPIDINEDGVFYLTTDVRSNILNWFPFQKTDEVLEVGCGCGTITGMLCDRCKSVYSIDGSKRRSQITYYRHKNKDNLTVYAGNFEKIKIDKKFDYVILIGVFEYSKIFFNEDNPFDYFLKKIKEKLKPDGKVLLAIENRYGLKYWVGCNEDHLNRPYVGLEGYDDTNIQTFGKQEFIRLIESHGFCNYKFFYPFPDYKLPTVVYSDDRLPKLNEIKDLPIYFYGGNELFNSHKTLEGILENNMFDFFSNSFLIEFGLKNSVLSDVSYAKNLSYRNLDYKIITLQTEKNKIFKVADNVSSIKHLKSILSVHEELEKNQIKVCKVKLKNQVASLEYINGKTFGEFIKNCVKNKSWNMIELEIDKLVSFYRSISVYKKISCSSYEKFIDCYNEKDFFLKVPIVDGNASNIIIQNNGDYVFIDQEWLAIGDLPMDYLVYFSLLYIFSLDDSLIEHFPASYFYKKYNITVRKISAFNAYNDYYFKKEKKVIDVSKKQKLDSCLISNLDRGLFSVLYYDIGNDFNEKNKIIKKYKHLNDKTYSVTFKLPKGVKRVRFDPQIVGNKFVYFNNLCVNERKIKYDKYNIIEFNKQNTLLGDYPFVVFPFQRGKLTISIDFSDFSESDIHEYLNNTLKEKDIYQKEILDLTNKLDDMKKRGIKSVLKYLKNKFFRKFKV